MPGKIRAQTLKHIICLIFSIVIALAMSLHFSERIFAAESLPPVDVEEGAESTQREEVLPEAGLAGTEGESDQAESMLYAASEGDAVNVNTMSEEASVNATGDKAGDVGADSKMSEEAAKTDAPQDAEKPAEAAPADSAAELADAGNPAYTASTDGAAEPADAGKSAEAAPADSAAEPMDAGKSADTAPADSAVGPADAGKTADAGQSDIETADAENTAAAAKSTEPKSAEAKTADAESAEAKIADAESADVKPAEAKSTETGAADTEEVNSGSAAEDPLVKAGESVDPLIYLLECLKYHGGETDPAAFSLRAYTEDGQSIVTPVKDQTPWQTCWGFSAIASSETSILSECYAKWDQLAPGLPSAMPNGISSLRGLRRNMA